MKKSLIKITASVLSALLVSSCVLTTMPNKTYAWSDADQNEESLWTGEEDNDTTFVPDTEGVGGFVARMYTTVLNREAEEEGYLDWMNRLQNLGWTGAQIADGFLDSQEFYNRGLSNEDYVTVLYSVFFDREPDTDGFNDWVSQLEAGTNRGVIRAGFINSTEWANTCLEYGILSGGTGVPNRIPDPSEGIVTFVTALYNQCFGREPDQGGFNDWTTKLTTQTATGKEVAYGFFFSAEFTEQAKTMTDEELVEVFYTVFLDRPSDEWGRNDWLNTLAWGGGVAELFSGFADSEEFRNKCVACGVLPGPHINVGGSDTLDPDFANFVRGWDVQRGLERLSEATLNSHRDYNLYNTQGDTTVTTNCHISDREWQVVQSFAMTHFKAGWSAAQKVAYTEWWLHNNMAYGSSRGGYAESAFVYKSGQCAQYNGALLEVMCYLGYDANLIQGYRGSNPNGGSQHFWTEVTINGTVYVMEAGNTKDGSWHYFVALYSETRKYIKNKTLMS